MSAADVTPYAVSECPWCGMPSTVKPEHHREWETVRMQCGSEIYPPRATTRSLQSDACKRIASLRAELARLRPAPVAVGAQGTPGYEWRSTLDRMPMDTWLICSNQDARLFWAKQAPRSGQWTFGGVGFRDPTHWLAPRLSISPQPSVPVAVEVLDPPKREKDCGDCVQIAHCNGALACACGPTGKMFIRKEVSPQPIRILKDGELAVPVEEWEAFQALEKNMRLPTAYLNLREQACIDALDALRSSKEGA